MNTPSQTIGSPTTCAWCGTSIDSSYLCCPHCGSPVGRSLHTSESGWTELPPIADFSRLRLGNSTCQIEGTMVPVADFNLAKGDFVYFSHHAMLWRDPSVELRRMSLAGGFTRLLAGLPIIMTEAHGPGHVALSRDEPGEMIALPLDAGQKIDVREQMFLAATRSVVYRCFDSGVWYQTDRATHYPLGRYMDRFVAEQLPGLLLLHAAGNVFVRTLAAGETLLVKSAALIFKDPAVRMTLKIDYGMSYGLGGYQLMWIHLMGPGRVAIRSAYAREPAGNEQITAQSTSPYLHNAPITAVMKPTPSRLRPLSPTQPQSRPDPRHQLIAKMAADALSDGVISAGEMQQIIQTARAQGLSEYDVRLVINHTRSHGA